MIKALLLDFNGVIIDDEPIHLAAYKQVLSEEGIDLTEEKYLGCLGMNDRAFVKAIYDREGKEQPGDRLDSLLQSKSGVWRETVATSIPLFPGADDFIRRMASEFTLGIVSMARREEIDFVLETTGLRSYFAAIVSAEDVSTFKPDPECYRLGFRLVDEARTAIGKSPLTHDECVVVEDSPPGLQSAKSAGLQSLGITNTVAEDLLREAGARSVTKSLSDWSPETFKQVFRK